MITATIWSYRRTFKEEYAELTEVFGSRSYAFSFLSRIAPLLYACSTRAMHHAVGYITPGTGCPGGSSPRHIGETGSQAAQPSNHIFQQLLTRELGTSIVSHGVPVQWANSCSRAPGRIVSIGAFSPMTSRLRAGSSLDASGVPPIERDSRDILLLFPD